MTQNVSRNTVRNLLRSGEAFLSQRSLRLRNSRQFQQGARPSSPPYRSEPIRTNLNAAALSSGQPVSLSGPITLVQEVGVKIRKWQAQTSCLATSVEQYPWFP